MRRASELLGLRQVLMRGAVAVVRQRHPLARRALAGARATLQRVAVDVEAVLRLAAQELVGEVQVALDHAQHAQLRVIGKYARMSLNSVRAGWAK